jgi:Na+(H+)/acetate symporter ActP
MLSMSISSTASSPTASASSSSAPVGSTSSGDAPGGTTNSQNRAARIVAPQLALNATVVVGLVAAIAL